MADHLDPGHTPVHPRRHLGLAGWAVVALAAVAALPIGASVHSPPAADPPAAPSTTQAPFAFTPEPTTTTTLPPTTINPLLAPTDASLTARAKTALAARPSAAGAIGSEQRAEVRVLPDGRAFVRYRTDAGSMAAYPGLAAATLVVDAPLVLADPAVTTIAVVVQDPGTGADSSTDRVLTAVQLDRAALTALAALAPGDVAASPGTLTCLGARWYVDPAVGPTSKGPACPDAG